MTSAYEVHSIITTACAYKTQANTVSTIISAASMMSSFIIPAGNVSADYFSNNRACRPKYSKHAVCLYRIQR